MSFLTSYPTSSLHPWIRNFIHTRRKSVSIAILLPNSTHTLRGGWSGGSCEIYGAFNINTRQEISLAGYIGDYFSSTKPDWIQQQDVVLVAGGTCCGKPSFVKFYLATDNPSDINKFFVCPQPPTQHSQ